MALASSASREIPHLGLTTLLLGLGWPAYQYCRAGTLALGIDQVFQDEGKQGGS